MNDVLETLIAARKRIQTPETWCQSLISRMQGTVRQYCALGAMYYHYPYDGTPTRAQKFLNKALPKGHESVGMYNDSHTHAEVLALYDRAIHNAKTVVSLKAAMARITNPKNWIKGVYAKDAYGRMCMVHHGVSFCALGATLYETGTQTALKGALPKRKGWHYVAEFNDHPNTTHKQVLNLYKRAITNLGGTP